MNLDMGLLLAIIGVGAIFFCIEWIPAEVVALSILVAIILCGLLTPDEAFAGFGSGTVIMLLGLLIMTASLVRTGLVEIVGSALMQRTGKDPNRVLIVMTGASSLLSAVMSNTATTAFFLPLAQRLAKHTGTSPSRFLMPLAFAAIASSSVTLISTSTNIVVSGLMVGEGMAPMGMFELTPVGLPIAIVALAYLHFARSLIPERAGDEGPTYGLGEYLAELIVLPDSPLVGKTLEESGVGRDLNLTVVRVIRSGSSVLPNARLKLAEHDVLLVEGERDDILKVRDAKGLGLKPEVTLPHADGDERALRLVEVILLPGSALIGRTLRALDFRNRYGLQVLGVNREGRLQRRRLSDVRLRLGDALLVQGPDEAIVPLQRDSRYRVLGAVESTRLNVARAKTAVVVFAAAVALATFNVMTLPVAMLLGAVGVFVTRCITPAEAYREVEWSVILLVGSMLAVGAAMEKTGTAAYLAGAVVHYLGQPQPWVVLSVVFAAVVVLTQPMSNQAAATVLLPVAVQMAVQLHMNPRTVCMMIAVAASCSYMTPLEPSCLMVYGPGRYRFMDFMKVGAILTALIYLIAIVLVPLVWPPGAP